MRLDLDEGLRLRPASAELQDLLAALDRVSESHFWLREGVLPDPIVCADLVEQLKAALNAAAAFRSTLGKVH